MVRISISIFGVLFILAQPCKASWIYLNFNDDKPGSNKPFQEISVFRKHRGAQNLEVISGDPHWLDGQSLSQKLSGIQKQNIKETTLIISGHHSRLSFAGKVGSLTSQETHKVFLSSELQPLRQSVRSIYLLGCYTLNPLTLDFWLKAFPNLQFAVGYNDLSPLNYTEKNAKLLSLLMAQHGTNLALSKLGNLKAISENLKSINTHFLPLSIYANPRDPTFLKYDVPSKKIVYQNLKKMKAVCQNVTTNNVLTKIRETFDCYLKATDECRDVPKSTSASPLRQAYSQFADLSHCLADDSTMLESEEVIRLIYFHKLLSHYRKVFQKELIQVRDTVLKLNKFSGKSETDFLFKALSRKDWLDGMDNLMQKYASFDQQSFLEKFFRSAEYYLYRPSPYCIPLGWVDDNPKEAPLCGFDPADKKYL